jgi:peptidyl-prolyl cis-trans isomerase A (cyclophilin A)
MSILRSQHFALLLPLALALGAAGCEKAKSEPPAKPTPPVGGRAGDKANPGKGDGEAGASRPREQPAPTPAEEEVRAPQATDLPGYLADLPGDGPLVATFVTSMGELHCELFAEQVPMTVANFVGLARGLKPFRHPRTNAVEKRPYFDGLIFHRVIPDFMIQGGDPLGIGRGGPGYRFGDEFVPSLRHDKGGTLSMANAGPGTNGSQFFITERATPHLDNRHTVFGRCQEVDLIKKIARVEKSPDDPTGSKPLEDIIVERVVISREAKK